MKVYPGDVGTAGGLVTDDRGRVLMSPDTAIPGLYACGTSSASVMGYTYPGPGATIAPAMIFGRIAALDAVEAGSVEVPEKPSFEKIDDAALRELTDSAPE